MQFVSKVTERFRGALGQAHLEAKRHGHDYIGPEHLFLALLRDEGCGGAKVLMALGVDLMRARHAMEFMLGHGAPMMAPASGLTPQANKIIQRATEEARGMRHSPVGTEHLLLGLVREGEGIAAGILASLGVDVEKARGATRKACGQPPHSLDEDELI